MATLATRITEELRVLVGEPLTDCWRVTDMQIFGFGPLKAFRNRQGDEVQGTDIRLHVQCSWRMVDGARILFAGNDLFRPAHENMSREEFDWDEHESALDARQHEWFNANRDAPPRVVAAAGDKYGGCRIALENNYCLELFPCHSERGEYSEHWRLLGHRADESHFVVTGHGVEE